MKKMRKNRSHAFQLHYTPGTQGRSERVLHPKAGFKMCAPVTRHAKSFGTWKPRKKRILRLLKMRCMPPLSWPSGRHAGLALL